MANPLWVKGVTGNAGGRPKLPEHLRLIKAQSPEEVRRLISLWCRLTTEEAIKRATDPATSLLEKAIARVFSEAIEKGDPIRLEFLLNRCIGKPQERPQSDEEDLSRLSDAELLERVKGQLEKVTG